MSCDVGEVTEGLENEKDRGSSGGATKLMTERLHLDYLSKSEPVVNNVINHTIGRSLYNLQKSFRGGVYDILPLRLLPILSVKSEND